MSNRNGEVDKGPPRPQGGEREEIPPTGPSPEEGTENILDGEERRWDEENPGDDEPGEAP